jgi:hypothetical protein
LFLWVSAASDSERVSCQLCENRGRARRVAASMALEGVGRMKGVGKREEERGRERKREEERRDEERKR